jgi:hypothetical protein
MLSDINFYLPKFGWRFSVGHRIGAWHSRIGLAHAWIFEFDIHLLHCTAENLDTLSWQQYNVQARSKDTHGALRLAVPLILYDQS